MSEVNLTLTAKPFTVSTRVKWAQNATILHYVAAKCEMHRGSLVAVFVRLSEKLDRRTIAPFPCNWISPSPAGIPASFKRNLSNLVHCTLSSRSQFVSEYCVKIFIFEDGDVVASWKFLDLRIELYYYFIICYFLF